MVPEPELHPIAQTAREQMDSLDTIARAAYKNSRHTHAAEIWEQALEIAESIDDANAILEYRYLRGAALRDAGRLSQSIAAMVPALQSSPPSGGANHFYNLLTIYIYAAQDLPVSLGAIEKAYAQTESFLRDSGNIGWRHKLLHLRSQLYSARGMYSEALRAAQEGWSLRQRAGSYPAFGVDDHLNDLVDMNLRLQYRAQASRYLEEWESQKDNELPRTREILYCSRQSGLARLEGRADDAMEWARRAVLSAEQTDDEGGSLLAGSRLVRALLYAADIERAKERLCRIVAFRHSESKHRIFDLYMLRGDYHLACARQAAGMAPADDEYGLDFPPPTHIADAKATRRELRCARRAYDTALKIGREIDDLLECTKRQEELAGRFERVGAIEDRVTP